MALKLISIKKLPFSDLSLIPFKRLLVITFSNIFCLYPDFNQITLFFSLLYESTVRISSNKKNNTIIRGIKINLNFLKVSFFIQIKTIFCGLINRSNFQNISRCHNIFFQNLTILFALDSDSSNSSFQL